MSRGIFHQPRVLRAPSSLALNTAREGAATASLGNLGQGLTTLMGIIGIQTHRIPVWDHDVNLIVLKRELLSEAL